MWKRLAEKTIYEGYRVLVQRLYALPSGREHWYDIVKGRPVVCALMVSADGRFVLTRQFRPGPEQELFVLPGGVIDPGETPLQAIERECFEETGFVGKAEFLASTWAGAYSTTLRHHFLIREANSQGESHVDPDEIAGIVLLSPQETLEAVWRGDVMDVETLLLGMRRLASTDGSHYLSAKEGGQ
jgi:ADP-ribose pyrophosphatase